jgi:hypothetical protein
MATDSLDDLMNAEFKEAFDEFDKVREQMLFKYKNIFGLLTVSSLFFTAHLFFSMQYLIYTVMINKQKYVQNGHDLNVLSVRLNLGA